MPALRSVLPSIALLLLLLAAPASAGDEKSEIWRYTKGDEVTELDVTAMPEAIRKALHTQLVEKGWSRSDAPKKEDAVEPRQAEAPKTDTKEPDAPGIRPETRKDLEELIRRGGKLPEGFVPHAGRGPHGGPFGGPLGGPLPQAATGAFAKASGRLLLRYLEVKDDPVKGPVFEGVLRELGQALVALGEDPRAGVERVAMNLMGKVLGGLADPEKAPVYREIMQIFGEAMTEGMTQGMTRGMPPEGPPSEADGPFRGAPREIGGALIAYLLADGRAAPPGQPAMGAVVVRVPKDSPAEQAGLRPYDRIEQINGKPTDAAGLKRAHEAFVKGGKLLVRVRRKDDTVEELEIDITLDEPAAGDAPEAGR